MKKIITGCLLFLLITAFSVVSFATEIPYEVTYNYGNNEVIIEGEMNEACEYISLQILKDGYTFSEYDDGGEQLQILWRGQADAENGKYSFKVGYPDSAESKAYEARLTANDEYEKTLIKPLMLVNKTDYENTVDELNRLASESDYDSFDSFVKTNGYMAGFDLSLLNKLAGNRNLKEYFNYVKNNPLNADDSKVNVQVFNTFILMEALNQGKISNIEDYIKKTIIIDSQLYDEYKNYCADKTEQEYATSKMLRKNIDSIEKFEKTLKEAILLEEIYYASGFGDVRDIIKAYGSVAGINDVVSDTICKKMAGKDYSDISAFLRDYQMYKESGVSGGSGGSSGGGGGGSSSRNDVKVQIESGIVSTNGGIVNKKDVYFEDIDGIEWASEAILALADKGIINGKAEGYFYPNDSITREEFAKIMVIALGYEDETVSGNYFDDVNTGDWFSEYVNIAFEKNILKGVGEGKFGTGMLITRQDMCVMIYNALLSKGRALDKKELSFGDSFMIAPYAYDAVASLYEAGIVNGVSETEINPTGNASRAQAAKIVYGMLKLF